MSESKMNKFLYKFEIQREVEIDKEEQQVINGENVKVTRKVKEYKPVKFALKKPNRKLYEEGELFYGVKLSEGIRAGLLTRALLLKRYLNDGGALSDSDAQYFHKLGEDLTKLENEHQRINANIEQKTDEEKKKLVDEVVKKKIEVLQNLQALESVNQALFAHTAETKAQQSLNNFWIVNLSFWDKDNNDEYVEFFPGKTFEEKMEVWDDYDEKRDAFTVSVLTRFALLVGLWNAGAQTEEEFKQGERDYGVEAEKKVEAAIEADKLSDKKEEPPTEKKTPEDAKEKVI